MDITGVINIDFINEQGIKLGSQLGLIMSYYDQTVVFSPFTINKNHFTHTKYGQFIYNDKIIHLDNSRYSYPFLIRVWTLPSGLCINPASELTINLPKKSHNILGYDFKIDTIIDKDINFWHQILPPFLGHEINNIYPLGTITYFNNKVTSIVVSHFNKCSILVNVFTLKQIITGMDFNYSGLYYSIKLKPDRKTFYVYEDWDQYENGLKKDDIILEIENVPINIEMYYEKLSRDLYIDTWITMMYIEKDNIDLTIKIKRNDEIKNVKIPRKPLYNIMQIPYYSNDICKVSFELMHTDDDRFIKIGKDLLVNSKKLFI